MPVVYGVLQFKMHIEAPYGAKEMAMKVKLMVSHPANKKPGRIKMARVDGCTFFRKEDGWRHVDKSCERNDHWVWNMEIRIGECVLVRSDKMWMHRTRPCLAGRLFLDVRRRNAEKVTKMMQDKKMQGEIPDEMRKEVLKETQEELRSEIEKGYAERLDGLRQRAAELSGIEARSVNELIDALQQEMAKTLQTLEDVEKRKPICVLDPEDIPTTVGSCSFTLEEDGFHHLGTSCKLREHFAQDDDRTIRLTREPGWKRDEFVEAANTAIGKALAMVQASVREHILVEV